MTKPTPEYLTKLNATCAELIDYKPLEQTEWLKTIGKQFWTNPDGGVELGLPKFTESADAVIHLINHLKKGGKDWRFQYAEFKDGRCCANFYLFSGANNCTEHVTGSADNFALAVCYAFLKAHDINPLTIPEVKEDENPNR